MPERMESYRRVENGDYRPLLRGMSVATIAGLLSIIDDSVLIGQACEVLSGRKPRVVHSDSPFYINDSILDLYR